MVIRMYTKGVYLSGMREGDNYINLKKLKNPIRPTLGY